MGVGYVGGLAICTATMPIVGTASAIILGTATLIGGFRFHSELFGYALLSLLVLSWSWIFWRLAERFIVDAQRRVIGKERTPYWVSGVNCGYATEQYMKQFESPHA
jgi:hypothetical protein